MALTHSIITRSVGAALDHSDDEEEQNAVVAQVLDEIGIEITDKLSKAPVARGALAAEGSKAKGLSDSDLEAQLAKLKM